MHPTDELLPQQSLLLCSGLPSPLLDSIFCVTNVQEAEDVKNKQTAKLIFLGAILLAVSHRRHLRPPLGRRLLCPAPPAGGAG